MKQVPLTLKNIKVGSKIKDNEGDKAEVIKKYSSKKFRIIYDDSKFGINGKTTINFDKALNKFVYNDEYFFSYGFYLTHCNECGKKIKNCPTF